jgi:hypothetical protein
MNHIGFDKKFTLLAQEAHLAKNTLLSGFDLLLKANFFKDTDGYFYSAFFHLSIGMERILKLAVVTHYMLENDYKTPTIKQLKKEFGHNVSGLYEECRKLVPMYRASGSPVVELSDEDASLVDFFADYGIGSRYFNLNEVCEMQMDRSPLLKWLDIARSLYEDHTSWRVREKAATGLMYKMDKNGPPNDFTCNLDEGGHPMTVFDCLHRQMVVAKSAPIAIWRIIEILRPIHYLLESMAHKSRAYEERINHRQMVIPHYEDFFYFLLADRDSIKRRRTWLRLFNG